MLVPCKVIKDEPMTYDNTDWVCSILHKVIIWKTCNGWWVHFHLNNRWPSRIQKLNINIIQNFLRYMERDANSTE